MRMINNLIVDQFVFLLGKKVIFMFSYIQILEKDSTFYKGYIDYEFSDNVLSITMVRGARALHRIKIPLNEITDLAISNDSGEGKVSFIYQAKKYTFFNTGYGESTYFMKHISKTVTA